LSPSEWTLGGLGAVGLVGFAVIFVLVLNDTLAAPPAAEPDAVRTTPASTVGAAPSMPARGEPGPRGERGPAGPAGRPGDPGIRILRSDCVGGNCTVNCDDGEVLLTAHCGIGRTPAIYPDPAERALPLARQGQRSRSWRPACGRRCNSALSARPC
jgi:hypothetical protein